MIAFRLYVLFLSFFSVVQARESITSFVSDIVVNTDGTFLITERIEVISELKSIVHGIIREFPTRYHDRLGISYVVDFTILSVTQDGKPASFWIESVSNGKKLYIGQKDQLVSLGKHEYVISYETNRQCGFFEKHDELYWNVTGIGWRLPIDRVQAHVKLPEGILSSSITAEGYSGFQGEQKQEYESVINESFVSFVTTRSLDPYEGLTIVVTFPKGFVVKPSSGQEFWWLVRDNVQSLMLLLQILFAAAMFIVGFVLMRRKNRPGVVIPLFYPPQNMTPSVVGYMKNRGFKDKFLSADIVDLAVRGFITITFSEGGFFGNTSYTLTKNKDVQVLNDYDKKLLSNLFVGQKDSLIVSKNQSEEIQEALQGARQFCKNQAGAFIVNLPSLTYYACMGEILLMLLSFVVVQESAALLVAGVFFLLFFMLFFSTFFAVYTSEGRKLQDEIDGFMLYLTTAEIERMRIIGTPPTKTPELYEHYLPYAMALGVEDRWTAQFSPLFESLARSGHPYCPRWYGEKNWKSNQLETFTKSFSNSIASSSQLASKVSGSGGSGRSGGGGGGGGGGGW